MHSDRLFMRRGVPAAMRATLRSAMCVTMLGAVVACGTNDAGPLATDGSTVGIAALTARNDSVTSAAWSTVTASRGLLRDTSATSREAVTNPQFATWPFPERLALTQAQQVQIRALRYVFDQVTASEVSQIRSLIEQAAAATLAGRPAAEIEELLARIAVVAQRHVQATQRLAAEIDAILTPDQRQWLQEYQACLITSVLTDEKLEQVTAIKSHFEEIYADDLAATEAALRQVAALTADATLTAQERQERIAEILDSVRPELERLERGLIELERDLAAIVPPPSTCWED